MRDETTQAVEYVTVAEASRRLGINGHAVRQRAYRGSLPYRRDGKSLLIGLSAVADTETARETARTARDTARVPSDETPPDATAEVLFLRERLAARDVEIREMRAGYERQIEQLHVMLQTAQRQLPATVPDAPQPPVRNAEHESGIPAIKTAPVGSERVIRASWWRRLFGSG
jgi:hypothetical protein